MAKQRSKISVKERTRLLKEFCEALSVLKTPREIMDFIVDLLTKQEMIIIAKRIKIAKFLIAGKDYRSIENLLGVSHGTIAKVNSWLSEGGEGFRLIAKRTKTEDFDPEPKWMRPKSEWQQLKRRYPSMFWPQLLIEHVVKTMNEKQKKKLRNAIKKLDQKSISYKRISKILKY